MTQPDRCAPPGTEPDQQLGDYRAWMLDPGGAAPVDMIWVSKARKAAPRAHLITPHGEPSIAVRRRRDPRGHITDIDLVICGPSAKARWYRPRPGEELIAVRLKPESSAAAFDILAGDYLNAAPIVCSTITKKLGPGTLRAAEFSDALEVARHLFSSLVSFNRSASPPYTLESAAASILRKSGGRVGIRALAQHLDVSERHLRRRFQAALGMSPKTYARQLRITAAAMQADRQAAPDWAAIAAGSGYFDQAHMIAEFGALCGRTPVETHAARRAHQQTGSVFSNT